MAASPPASRGRRKRSPEEAEAKASAILDAALDTFAEKGFAAARMEDIAARAGVSKGTVYLYFPSKQAVFEALVGQAILPHLDRIGAMVAAWDGPASALLRQVVAVIPDLIRNPRVVTIPRLVIAEAANFPDTARFYKQAVIDRGMGLVAGILARGLQRGEFRPHDPQLVAKLVFAPFLLSVVWRNTFEAATGDRLDVGALMQAHLDLLLRGLAPDGETA